MSIIPEILTITIRVEGRVQGVGFRPFVYRLAHEMGVSGWVRNDVQGVTICAIASSDVLDRFQDTLTNQAPPAAHVERVQVLDSSPGGERGPFTIVPSDNSEAIAVLISPDLALCSDCLREMNDPADRRFRYPFINCTNCGPRFSIIRSLPYDRPNTTMGEFEMCPDCRAEYESPLDRRFHAQPNACPRCGPHVELWDQSRTVLASGNEAILEAAEVMRRGRIVALKGLGGFHLLVDARNEDAVVRLRQRKQREEKPFALMVPSLDSIRMFCSMTTVEEKLLLSPEAPIVLLQRLAMPKTGVPAIVSSVAPANPYLGVMLPYTPLHHMLMADLGFPVVATSGNLSDEPICIDENEATHRLGEIADVFVVHNRPIAHHVDDSVVRELNGGVQVLRCARGYAPLPVTLSRSVPPLLAVGAHLKNTVAISLGRRRVLISQHIGDLETSQAFEAFQCVISVFEQLYELRPVAVACDAHPGYLSTQYAHATGMPVVSVQHHFAHVMSCMAENGVEGGILGVSWDGTGSGPDGTVWGGEFLRVKDCQYERVAHLRTFLLPGGEKAVKEPRRSAIGLLYETYGDKLFSMKDLACVASFSGGELQVLKTMVERKLNTVATSSAGRLFDGISSILGIRQIHSFEGQAAMELEFALAGHEDGGCYPLDYARARGGGEVPCIVVDWTPMVKEIVADVHERVAQAVISARFHNTLINAIGDVAGMVGEHRVALTGGCFQNRFLLSRAILRLEQKGFEPVWHHRVPTNDNGIALGQIVAAAANDRLR